MPMDQVGDLYQTGSALFVPQFGRTELRLAEAGRGGHERSSLVHGKACRQNQHCYPVKTKDVTNSARCKCYSSMSQFRYAGRPQTFPSLPTPALTDAGLEKLQKQLKS